MSDLNVLRKALPEPVKQFLDHMSAIKDCSDLTLQGYALDLQLFFRFYKRLHNDNLKAVPLEEIDISDLTFADMQRVTYNDGMRFLSYCYRERHNDAAARARKATSLRRFFHYLSTPRAEDLYLEKNPFQYLESPKLRKTLPKYLTLDQSKSLLNAVDGNNRERDYCILTLFLNCGLRISELVGLNLSDIRPDDTMRILGKGNKERLVHLNPACRSALDVYLRVRPADDIADRNAVFISRNRKRISVRAVQNIVDKYLEKAGLADQGFSTHKLRHTAATLMYQYGNVDVLLLKEVLGHENLTTTEIYTHIVDRQLRDAIDANPLSGISPSPSDGQEDS